MADEAASRRGGERDPVFFDLQVNGYAGVDFNADGVTPDDLHRACSRLQEDGVEGCLVAVITDEVDTMCRRLSVLAAMRDRDPAVKRAIAGFHIEGPFLNAADGYRGAHPRSAIRRAEPDVMRLLLDAASGLARIVTLAPEQDPGFAVIRLLAREGLVVSAGHTDASTDLLQGAIDAGVSMFTHVGNGCPMTMHRHDNIVQRVLSLADRFRVSFIADGAHVPFVALRNYLRLVPLERCAIVTDCIAPAGLGPGRYTLGRWDIVVGDDMVPRSPDGSHFVGSGVTMQQSAKNLVERLNLPEETVRRLTYDNPKSFIGGAGL
jgi:N-acetylglucosamine-6-phosphate deacetylase